MLSKIKFNKKTKKYLYGFFIISFLFLTTMLLHNLMELKDQDINLIRESYDISQKNNLNRDSKNEINLQTLEKYNISLDFYEKNSEFENIVLDGEIDMILNYFNSEIAGRYYNDISYKLYKTESNFFKLKLILYY